MYGGNGGRVKMVPLGASVTSLDVAVIGWMKSVIGPADVAHFP